jgi:hypothetical protein
MPKTYQQKIDVKSETSVSVSGKGFKAGLSKTKGWFQKFFTGMNIKQADGTTADVTSYTKRKAFGNWYSEKVVDSVTGIVTHECEEPFDEHQFHGSDKPEFRAARAAEKALKVKGEITILEDQWNTTADGVKVLRGLTKDETDECLEVLQVEEPTTAQLMRKRQLWDKHINAQNRMVGARSTRKKKLSGEFVSVRKSGDVR